MKNVMIKKKEQEEFVVPTGMEDTIETEELESSEVEPSVEVENEHDVDVQDAMAEVAETEKEIKVFDYGN